MTTGALYTFLWEAAYRALSGYKGNDVISVSTDSPPPPHTQTSCAILITRLEPKPPLIFGWRNFLKIPIINQLLGEIEYNIVSSYFELLKSSKYQELKWILYCYFLNVSLSGCLIGSKCNNSIYVNKESFIIFTKPKKWHSREK